MIKNQKHINMIKANQAFQKRTAIEDGSIEEVVEYTPIPDFYPDLSKRLK